MNSFMQEHIIPRKPALIKSWLKPEKLNKKLLHYVKDNSSKISTIYHEKDETKKGTLKEIISKIKNNDSATYIKDFCVYEQLNEVFDGIDTPNFIDTDWTSFLPLSLQPKWKWMYWGNKGSGSIMHQDVMLSSAWSLNITGEKKWVFPVGLFEDDEYHSLSDSEKHNLETIQLISSPGDIVYVPPGIWHSVENLSESISITKNLIEYAHKELFFSEVKKSKGKDYLEKLIALQSIGFERNKKEK